MEHMQQALMEKLQPHTVFTIPLFGGIPVSDAVVVTWIIMLILAAASILLVRNLQTIPTGTQIAVEVVIGGINNFVKSIIGHEWKTFAPYLGTVALYLTIANTISIFGFTPPTKDLNVTAALSVMTMLIVIGAGIRFKGFGGWLKEFKEPIPIILPMKVLEMFVRPLSLAMRLFGNILGSFVIMELLYEVIPLAVPAILSLYFDIFDGLIQMVVFIFLSTLFIKEAIE
ncbi:MAG: F-type H+-transporting ATPase subunit a [Clostridiales bacterium]|jgi:F-type H+-transporting ATPase subunit a|nr:F-type H+-transporting ATPase subunit a [Clostridiales bacterium]